MGNTLRRWNGTEWVRVNPMAVLNASNINNDSSVTGQKVSDALNNLNTDKQKGIYQQGSTPSNPSTGDLWIDTNDRGGAVLSTWGHITGTLSDQSDLNTALLGKVSRNGTYTEAEKKAICDTIGVYYPGELVLIESIPEGTITENYLLRNSEPNGDPYNFDELVLRIMCNSSETVDFGYVFISPDHNNTFPVVAARYDSWFGPESQGEIRVFKQSGRWELECGKQNNSLYPQRNGIGQRSERYTDNAKLSVNPTIKQLKLGRENSISLTNVAFEIWAVRHLA